MRDRDLMHVDVNSPGVWARQSDVDLHDLALREVHGEDVTPRLAGGLSWEGGGPIGMGKVPGLKPSSQRSIAGDRLTEAALKEWTLKVRVRASRPPSSLGRAAKLKSFHWSPPLPATVAAGRDASVPNAAALPDRPDAAHQ